MSGGFSQIESTPTKGEVERGLREYAVLLLRLAKQNRTYRELSSALKLQITVLSRYVKGWVLPTLERSKSIIEEFGDKYLTEWLVENVKLDERGYFDNTKIAFNPTVLELASYDCVSKFAGRRVTAVLTAAVDGVPLATAIAMRLNSKLVVAKPYKETGVDEFVEYDEVSEDGSRVTWYIPAILRKNDDVLIVDDVVRKGRMLKILYDLARSSGSSVAGVYALVTIGEDYKNVVRGLKYETALLVQHHDPRPDPHRRG